MFIFSWTHPLKIVSLHFVTAANLVSGFSRRLRELWPSCVILDTSAPSQVGLSFPLHRAGAWVELRSPCSLDLEASLLTTSQGLSHT